jgi:hypothetical protein
MTAAFAIGQIAGPLTVSLLAGSGNAFALASLVAAVGLVAGICVLLARSARWEKACTDRQPAQRSLRRYPSA